MDNTTQLRSKKDKNEVNIHVFPRKTCKKSQKGAEEMMTLESHVMYWRMERLRSIRRMLGWNQGRRKKVLHVVLTVEGAEHG